MADDKGKGAYGTRHVMEEQMQAAGTGVFEPKSGEAGQRKRRKAAPAATETKAEGAAPQNKSASTRKAAANKNG